MTTTIAVPIFRLDLNLKQGAGATITLNTVDKLGQVITDPSGYTIRAQIRRTSTGPVLFEWNDTPSPAQGAATLAYVPGPPAASTVTLSFTDDHAALWTYRLARWDCFLTNPLGQATCLAAGVVRVEPYITHA